MAAAKGKLSAGLVILALGAWWWLARRAAPLTNAPAPAPAPSVGDAGGAAGLASSLVAPDALVYVAPADRAPGGYLTTGEDFTQRATGAAALGLGDRPRGSSYTEPTYMAPRPSGSLVYATGAAPAPDPWRDELVLDYARGRLALL